MDESTYGNYGENCDAFEENRNGPNPGLGQPTADTYDGYEHISSD